MYFAVFNSQQSNRAKPKLWENNAYLNRMIPPMKVTQRAAPQAVEKLSRWASLRQVESFGEWRPSDFDPKVSGENITPTAKKTTAVRNRVSQPIAPPNLFSLPLILEILEGEKKNKLSEKSLFFYYAGLSTQYYPVPVFLPCFLFFDFFIPLMTSLKCHCSTLLFTSKIPTMSTWLVIKMSFLVLPNPLFYFYFYFFVSFAGAFKASRE